MSAQQNSESLGTTGVTKVLITHADPGAPTVTKGNTVTVHCTGYLATDPPKKFWSTEDPGQKPFSFPVDMGKVIKGWDVACMSMKKGEKAKFTLPSRMGYGKRGFAAWKIPPDADLIFEIELLTINGQ